MSPADPAADPVRQFEAALKELETLVQQLEQGELSLERSIEVFERGMQLSQQCRGALDQATQRVETLLDSAEPRPE